MASGSRGSKATGKAATTNKAATTSKVAATTSAKPPAAKPPASKAPATKAAATSAKTSHTTKAATKAMGAKKPAPRAAPSPPAEVTCQQVKEPEPVVSQVKEPEPVVGQVHVRYNHYNEEFDVVDGTLDFEEVDEKYCISFVFKGDWKAKLRGVEGETIAPDGGALTKVKVESDDVNEDGDEKVVGSFSGLTIGSEYTLDVEEDPELEQAPRKVFVASGGLAGRQDSAADGSIGVSMGEDRSSCSCIFGNPCASPYNCKDWHNRHEVATKNGWKGFS